MNEVTARILSEAEEGVARRLHAPAVDTGHLAIALCDIATWNADVQVKATGLARIPGSVLAEFEMLADWFRQKRLDPVSLGQGLERQLPAEGKAPAVLDRTPARRKRTEEAEGIARRLGATHARLRDLAEACIVVEKPRSDAKRSPAPPKASPPLPPPANEPSPLDLGRDLTALARAKKIGPITGRRAELRQLARALSKRTRSNVLLIGEPGVGKTALVEGLAGEISAGSVLPKARVIEITPASLTAGAGYRGDLEQRLLALIAAAQSDPNLILFIDEIHALSTLSGKGGVAAMDVLKPALARGELRMIGATTPGEYERQLSKDEAFTRRFEMVWIEEPSRDNAIEIVRASVAALTQHHGVIIEEEAVAAAVDLSTRYMPDRRLPDKAIELLDDAAVRHVVRSESESEPGHADRAVTASDVATVVAARCGIPVERLVIAASRVWQLLASELKAHVAGQDEAIDEIARSVRARVLTRSDSRPLASFLFAGPTGVGKTETAKIIAETLFGSRDALVHLDMSEYGERHQVARLIGAPPGYVGFGDGGVLTSPLRRRPASVVLFDEIEKAHPDVLNLLLQVLDEGRLTDSQGRKVAFRECVIVLTTNLTGAPPAKRMGFGEAQGDTPAKRNALASRIRPEILGRIGAVVEFQALSMSALLRIADALLDRNAAATGEQLPSSVREHVHRDVEKAGRQFGGREIERIVDDAIASWLDRSQTGERNDT